MAQKQRFTIKVTPRSSQNRITEVLADGTIKVKLTAAPVDGAANTALIALLADEWQVPKSKITIIRGLTSRTKIVEVEK